MKFLCDECVYAATVKLLKNLGHDIITVNELGLQSSSDEKILSTATKKRRILLTFDQDFSNIYRFPLGTHSGIIIVKIKPHTVEDTNSCLKHFLEVTPPENISNSLVIVGKKKIRIRKPAQQT